MASEDQAAGGSEDKIAEATRCIVNKDFLAGLAWISSYKLQIIDRLMRFSDWPALVTLRWNFRRLALLFLSS
jgi:hypothetical protein